MIIILVLLCVCILGVLIGIYNKLEEFQISNIRMNYLLNKIFDKMKY